MSDPLDVTVVPGFKRWSCKCRLGKTDDGGAAIHFCGMHRNAAKMLEALDFCVAHWPECPEAFEALAAAIHHEEGTESAMMLE